MTGTGVSPFSLPFSKGLSQEPDVDVISTEHNSVRYLNNSYTD